MNIEARIDELMSRMTLEEIIMQTDQYYSHDFTQRDERGRVETVDMEKLDSLLRGMSCGSRAAQKALPVA